MPPGPRGCPQSRRGGCPVPPGPEGPARAHGDGLIMAPMGMIYILLVGTSVPRPYAISVPDWDSRCFQFSHRFRFCDLLRWRLLCRGWCPQTPTVQGCGPGIGSQGTMGRFALFWEGFWSPKCLPEQFKSSHRHKTWYMLRPYALGVSVLRNLTLTL